MTQFRRSMVALVLALLLAPAALGAGEANLLLGKKLLSDNDLEDLDVDSQNQFGVAVSLDFEWPVELAIDVLSSSDDHTATYTYDYPGNYSYTLQYRADVDTQELNVGVRKFWGERRRPYVGGGLAYAQLDGKLIGVGTFTPGSSFAFTVLDDDDSAVGFWINAGVLWRVGRSFNVGVDARYSDASAKLTPAPLGPGEQPPPRLKLDSGGTHIGVLLGYRW